MYRKFKPLNIPDGWEQYWSKYPNGYTIMEALIDWVSQVDDMVINQNELTDTVKSFGERIDDFINQFGAELQNEVQSLLTEWQTSGFLDVVISDALQWELDDYKATNEQNLLSIKQQLTQSVGSAPNKPMKILGGAIEPVNGVWEYITETFHDPMNLAGISQEIDRIRVDYSFLANKVNSFIAVPDETFIMYGLMPGTSVNDDNAYIKLYMPLSLHLKGRKTVMNVSTFFEPILTFTNKADGTGFIINHPHTFEEDVPVLSTFGGGAEARITSYTEREIEVTAFSNMAGTVSYNGSTWINDSQNVIPLSFNFESGQLIVTHPAFTNKNDIQISNRGDLIPVLGVISETQFTVTFKDFNGNIVSNPSTQMRFFYNSGEKVKSLYPETLEILLRRGNCVVIPENIETASGNIWLLGAHEIEPYS